MLGSGTVEVFGIRLVGATEANLTKLLLTIAAIGSLYLVSRFVALLTRATTHPGSRGAFWTRQGVGLAAFLAGAIALTSVWFDEPARLGTFLGFATAGLAIAAQKVVTAFAGYLVILRGKTFTVGDRIKMGGVRGDVVALGFLQTRILEMGQPPDVNEQENPGMWVRARQFSGRIVTVTNDKIFQEPVYNFTREFPFIWEEMHVPVPYRADRARAEQILLAAATSATARFAEGARRARERLQVAYGIPGEVTDPRVYCRLTDNWVELTVRFAVPEHGIREVKDRMARDVLAAFERAGLEIASATIEIARVPRLALERRPSGG